jgi:hypothetical protein
MQKYSQETEKIISEEVLPKLGYKTCNKTNIGEISEYIFNELEGPLADKAAEEKLNQEEQSKLNRYAKAVTEITTNKGSR